MSRSEDQLYHAADCFPERDKPTLEQRVQKLEAKVKALERLSNLPTPGGGMRRDPAI